ncbi:MAG: C25 family cysteine peptidase [Anaerolineae bacterium]
MRTGREGAGRWCVAALLFLGLLPAGAAPPPLESSPDRLIVEWTPPPPDFRPLPEGTVELVVEGYEIDERPGALRLPFTSSLIAIPPGATTSLRILSARTTVIPLPAPLAVAPEPVGAIQGEEGRPLGPAFAPSAQTVPAPSIPVALEEIGTVRGVRLARLTFYPILPEGDHLRFYRHVQVEVRFSGGGQPALSGDDPLLSAVRRAVLNPPHAIPAPSATPSGKAASTPQGGPREAFLEISRPGLYRVSYEDLQPLGFAGTDPANLRLFRGTEEVAYEWIGDDDAVFEPGEAVLFYAEPRPSRWTDRDVYRLVLGDAHGLRMTSRSANPTGLPAGVPWVKEVLEENRLYTPDRFTPGIPPGRDGDRWTWDYLIGSSTAPTTYSYPFSLSAVDSANPATLTLWMIGYTSGEHHWTVRVNGNFIGEVGWSGRAAVTTTLSLRPAILQEATNTLSLRSGVTEGAWLDAFAVHYARSLRPFGNTVTFGPDLSASQARAYTVTLEASGPYRAYDVTDPLHPQRLTDIRINGQAITVGDPPDGGPRRYHVAAEGAIRAPDRIRAREDLGGFRTAGGAIGADYLIITHPAFADAIGPLADLRRSQRLTVAVVNVLGIYDTYGDGRPDPEAIRRFVADAYANWNPRPAYVLLVGDGSYDPRRYLPTSPPTFIPPYLLEVSPAGGETAADNRYVCVDGDDNLPDLLLGRLPVKSADEARAAVGKIVDYETRPLPGGWNAHVVLVADDPDAAGDFIGLSEAAASWVTAPFTPTRRSCAGSNPSGSDCPEAEANALGTALLADWNRGALIVQYAGHASWQQWGVERFFHLDDLPSLANSRRYPVVAEMTCFTGAFHRPESTLDEELVTRPEAGAVAAWGPTGLGASTGHSRLAEGFFRAVFSDTVGTVSEAALAGQLHLAEASPGSDLLDTYVLLGDPALGWNRTLVPWTAHVFLPLVRR